MPEPGNKNRAVFKVAVKDKLTATCPGTGSRDRVSFECLPDKKFSREGDVVTEDKVLSALSCSKSIKESVVDQKSDSCGPEGSGANLVLVNFF